MQSDRELLELAAKAAGIKWDFDREAFDAGTYKKPWNPLTNDGDALRLSVKLLLDIHHFWSGIGQVCIGSQNGEIKRRIFINEHHGNDIQAATRRAIVRAAAELGRNTAQGDGG